MSFYYDHITQKEGLSQYLRFVENESYIRQLKSVSIDATNYQLTEIRRSLANVNMDANENFEKLTSKVCGTLENGFKEVVSGISVTNEFLEEANWRLNELNDGLDRLHSMLDWKTDLIIEELKINSLYLGRISELLKIPDSQKQRGYHVEQGLCFLKNAIQEGSKSDFYKDALEEFVKAHQIESKDYFTLHKIGLIYFSSVSNLDIEKADQFFRSAARFALAVSNSLLETGSINYQHSSRTLTKETLLIEAASALNYSSRCNYILNRKEEAVRLANEAFRIANKNPEYGVQLAKCQVANKKIRDAQTTLSIVIDLNREYFIKILKDPEFTVCQEVAEFLLEKAEGYIKGVEIRLTYLRNRIIDGHGYFAQVKTAIASLNETRTYLNACRINDLLDFTEFHEIEDYTYDDFYLRYKDCGNKYFKTGIKKEKKRYQLTFSNAVEKVYENFKKYQKYEELDVEQRMAAHKAAIKHTNKIWLRRITAGTALLIITVLASNHSIVLAVACLLLAAYYIGKNWDEYFT